MQRYDVYMLVVDSILLINNTSIIIVIVIIARGLQQIAGSISAVDLGTMER